MSKNYLREDKKRRSEVLKSLGVRECDFKRDKEIFKSWALKQQHLPKDFIDDDLFIECLLLNNKFRIEQSKVKYDNYFTLKAVYNSFYHDIEKVVPSKQPAIKIPLRNLTSDGKRILLICVTATDKSPKADVDECLKFHLATSEILNKYGFTDGRIVILDFKGLKSGVFENFDVVKLHKHLKILKTCFSGRVSSLHVVNLTNFANLVFTGVKMIFQGQISDKIMVHESFESLHKFIPQELLPKDYGGNDITVAEYLDIWDDIIKEEETFLKNLRYQCSDESLRIGSTHFNLQEFGVDGTFKQLNID